MLLIRVFNRKSFCVKNKKKTSGLSFLTIAQSQTILLYREYIIQYHVIFLFFNFCCCFLIFK